MSQSPAVGFGAFLIGLGAGWFILRNIELSVNTAAWLFIIVGAVIVASALFRNIAPNLQLSKIVGGIGGGLILALILTQGIPFIQNFSFGQMLPYKSTDQKTFTGVLSAPLVEFNAKSFNGRVAVSTWSSNDYRIDLTVVARGGTQQEADENLAKLKRELRKTETSEKATLELILNSPILINNPYQVTMEIKLPLAPKKMLNVETSNGGIYITDVSGTTINLKTSNGAIELTRVKADNIRCDTSNGKISGEAESTIMTCTTSNARIDLNIPGTLNGVYNLSTSNGEVSISLNNASGVKFYATTSNGEIKNNLGQTTYTEDTRASKRGQTTGYESASIKVDLTIHTSNSNVNLTRRNVSI